MAEGSGRERWAHTSMICALIANAHRDPRKSRPVKPEDFNPYAPRPRNNREADKQSLAELRDALEARTPPETPETMTMRLIILIIIVALLAGLVSCELPGRITTTTPDGQRIEVDQPGKAVAPATLTWGPDGSLVISTGNMQKQTPAMIAAGKTWIAWIVGPLLMVAGVGAFVLKKWLPILPTTAGTYLIACGAGVMALAVGLPALPTWVWIVIALGLGLWLIVPGLLHNHKQLQKTTTQTAVDTAGANV